MRKNFKENKYIIIYVLITFFYFWMAAQVPYTHDDWDWGLNIGIQQLVTASINSRYVGNFLEVIMTRCVLLKTLIMGAVYFFIPYIIMLIVTKRENTNKNRQILIFISGNVLLLMMHISIWQQTYGWIAGFANFVVSAFCICIYIYEIDEVFSNQSKYNQNGIWHDCLLLLLCVIMQLFIENVTLYMVLISGIINVVVFVKSRRLQRKYLLMLFGNVVGTIIMFSSSIYTTLWSTGEAVNGYRSLAFSTNDGIVGIVFDCIWNFAQNLSPNIYGINNIILCLATLLLQIILIFKSCNLKSKIIKIVFISINIILGLYYCTDYLFGIGYFSTDNLSILFHFCMNVTFIIAIALEVILLYKNEKSKMYKQLFFWFSIPAIIVPLAATNEFGPRLFFTSNLFFIIFILSLFNEVLNEVNWKIRNIFLILSAVILVCLGYYYGKIYMAIGNCNRLHQEIISEALETESEEIILPQYPYDWYLWCPYPTNEIRMVYFKEFYGIPEDVKVYIE